MAEVDTPDSVTFDDNEPKSGFAKLTLGIPGLEVSKALFGDATAKNTTFNEKKSMFQERNITFEACVTNKNTGEVKKYYYKKDLPLAIKADGCDMKVKDKFVKLILCKAENCSWAQYERDLMTSD